mmetsp:Transcript_20217/g.46591  ORF Transcript_20217/g.46591 Transcript_20217/m.46591 type:complete len:122 (-) Transcript_20217:426-791(-)
MSIQKSSEDRYKFAVKYPYLPKFEYDVRILLKRDFPDKGSITWVFRSLKKDGETLDMTQGAPCGKGWIKPKGEGCVLCNIEEVPSLMKFVPTFLLNWFMTSFFLKLLKTQENKFKKFKGIA